MKFMVDEKGNKQQRCDQAYFIDTDDNDSEAIKAGIGVA